MDIATGCSDDLGVQVLLYPAIPFCGGLHHHQELGRFVVRIAPAVRLFAAEEQAIPWM
jgi:hypothetical protein